MIGVDFECPAFVRSGQPIQVGPILRLQSDGIGSDRRRDVDRLIAWHDAFMLLRIAIKFNRVLAIPKDTTCLLLILKATNQIRDSNAFDAPFDSIAPDEAERNLSHNPEQSVATNRQGEQLTVISARTFQQIAATVNDLK